MESGYVLDFVNRTFADFLARYNVDIDDPKFADLGTSKANRLRSFLRSTPPPLVGQVLVGLLEHRIETATSGYGFGYSFGEDRIGLTPEEINAYRHIAARFGGGTPTIPLTRTPTPVVEPTMSADDYEHILTVCQRTAEVMERDPAPFRGMEEEHLRTHFLVQLNGHYKGGASGETFNYTGKTDILVRHQDRVAFVSECKFWTGPGAFHGIVGQLLGYTCWRDTKTAILLFSRNRDTSAVVAQVPGLLRSHPHHLRDLSREHETQFRCVLRHRDDPDREITLTVLVFDVPR